MGRSSVNSQLEEQIRRQPEFDRMLNTKAREIRDRAARIPTRRTGHYARTLRVIGNRVVSFDIAGHLLEWGSANNPAFAPLRRAARAAGLRLRERSK